MGKNKKSIFIEFTSLMRELDDEEAKEIEEYGKHNATPIVVEKIDE